MNPFFAIVLIASLLLIKSTLKNENLELVSRDIYTSAARSVINFLRIFFLSIADILVVEVLRRSDFRVKDVILATAPYIPLLGKVCKKKYPLTCDGRLLLMPGVSSCTPCYRFLFHARYPILFY